MADLDICEGDAWTMKPICEECHFPVDLNGLNVKNFMYQDKVYHRGCFNAIYIPRRKNR